MAQPTNREEFKAWCLRKLGAPVIEINADPDQIEDRIDEAISYFHDYHFDGAEKVFLKHQITANTIADGYITIPENINGTINIFDINDSIATTGMFSVQYQFALNEMYNLTTFDLLSYYTTMTHINFIQEMLIGRQPLRYNRHTNKLYIDIDWDRMSVGNYFVIEAYQVIDPDVYADMWKDRWLQNYATAKIKYQWGSNLTKFEGMQLPGGVSFNGQQILSDANEEINRLEEEMISSYSLPVTDMIG